MTGAPLLGGLSPSRFLRAHWQKRLLFVARALPEIDRILSPRELIALAQRDDVESRLVTRSGPRWTVRHGPIRPSDVRRLPSRGWTLLVQGVDQHVRAARALMRRFAFIPYARHDDLMVSLAPPGGGVGPHFDSYDVFLLQGRGKRRWRVSEQRDLGLVEDAPLRILRQFVPERELIVGSGDLLYLPPGVAHEGVAIDECMTLSVGMRAPTDQEIAVRFTEWLQEILELEGRYADPNLRAARHPGKLPLEMVRSAQRTLARVTWRPPDVARFLGCYLTEPKPNVWFQPPRRRTSRASFGDRMRRVGIELSPKSRMLVHGRVAFINGEAVRFGANDAHTMLRLADSGRLAGGGPIADSAIDHLHRWYLAGYVEFA